MNINNLQYGFDIIKLNRVSLSLLPKHLVSTTLEYFS